VGGLAIGASHDWLRAERNRVLYFAFNLVVARAVFAGRCYELDHRVGSWPILEAMFHHDHPDVVVVTHAGAEARRTWPVEAIKPELDSELTALAGELAAWFQEIHAYEAFPPLPADVVRGYGSHHDSLESSYRQRLRDALQGRTRL
jgi:hypothetical protein